jgi:GTPase SAR1 family protein
MVFFNRSSIRTRLERNSIRSKSNDAADGVRDSLCALQECPALLNLQPLLSFDRVAAVAREFVSKGVACSSLTKLSLRNVKMQRDVMHLVCTALHSATLQQLDVTNCGLTDEAAEALLHFMKSSLLTDVQLGGNAWSSQELSRMLQACSAVTSLGLAGLGESCFQPKSSCLPPIAAMTNLITLHVEGFNESAADAVLSQCWTGVTGISLKDAKEVMQLPVSLSKLTGLTSLNMNGCSEMYSLPLWLQHLTCLTQLSLTGCSIQHPPPVYLKSPQKIREFLQEAARTAEPWRRLKVVFLGNGRSGKTSLLRALAKLPLDSEEQSTRGVTVDAFADRLQPNMFDTLRDGFNIELSYWDFAGQLEYSASHDFFMSNRQAVYVIVFSAMDDRESQQQQLVYWLSAVARRSLQRLVRVMVVGTKTDLLYEFCVGQAVNEARTEAARGAAAASDAAVAAAATSKLKEALGSMRLMVSRVLEDMGLSAEIAFGSRESVIKDKRFSPVIASKEVLFVTSNNDFRMQLATANGPVVETLNFKDMRRALKVCLFSTCNHIFQTADSALNYPKRFRDMSKKVDALKKALSSECEVPFCPVTHQLAVKHLGGGQSAYAADEQLMEALRVLDSLGILVLYQVAGALCICAEPQYLSSMMSLLADPQSAITSVTTVELLEEELIKECGITRCKVKRSAQQLRELLVSVGLVVVSQDDAAGLIIPLALRGRPVSWREVHQLQEAFVMGRRLGSSASRVSALAFMQLMRSKCAVRGRMMGCAFMYGVENGGLVFVRLLEDRSKVDVVVVSSNGQGARAEVSACVSMSGCKAA